jgi:hypothetical protein
LKLDAMFVVDRFHLIILLTIVSIPKPQDVNYAYKPIIAELQLCCFSMWIGLIHTAFRALCVNIYDLSTSGSELQIPCSSSMFTVEDVAKDSTSLLPMLPNRCYHKLWYILSPELINYMMCSLSSGLFL